jgi:hypothetical protein
MFMTNSMRILYNTYILIESLGFFESTNTTADADLVSHCTHIFLSSIWQTQNIWSVIDLL